MGKRLILGLLSLFFQGSIGIDMDVEHPLMDVQKVPGTSVDSSCPEVLKHCNLQGFSMSVTFVSQTYRVGHCKDMST